MNLECRGHWKPGLEIAVAAPTDAALTLFMSDQPHAPPRTRKPRGQGASRRGEILAAATRIFLVDGVANATMRRIAAAVGVSTTALYVYFPDKDAILQAIAEATFAEMLAVLEASQLTSDAPADQMRAGLRAYVGFGLSRPDAYRLTFLSPGVRKPAESHADRSFAILEHSVAAMMAAGLFRPDATGAVAEAIWASMHGVTMLLLDQAEQCETPPEQLVTLVIEMIMNGLAQTERCKLN